MKVRGPCAKVFLFWGLDVEREAGIKSSESLESLSML